MQFPAKATVVGAISGVFTKLQLLVIYSNISKHKGSFVLSWSGTSDKFHPAFGTGYLDFPMALWNADLLLAVGTAIDPIDLSLLGKIFLSAEKMFYLISLSDIDKILMPSFGMIF
jgi:hypothetical protein